MVDLENQGTQDEQTTIPTKPRVILGGIFGALAGVLGGVSTAFGFIMLVAYDNSSSVFWFSLIAFVFGGVPGAVSGAVAGLILAIIDWRLQFSISQQGRSIEFWLLTGAILGGPGGGIFYGILLSDKVEIRGMFVGFFFGAIGGLIAGPIFGRLYKLREDRLDG